MAARKLAKKKTRRKKNPELLIIANPADKVQLKAAAKQYRQFHGVAPVRAFQRGRGKNPRVLVAMGDVVEVVYEPRRGQRKRVHWHHRFKRRAVLAASEDRQTLYIFDPKGGVLVDFKRGIVG